MVGKRSAARFAGAFALVASTAAVVWAAAGDLDTTFDWDGVVTLTPAFGTNDSVTDCVVESDGQVVVVGGETATRRWKIGRWNADGTLDTTFGSGGTLTLFGPYVDGQANIRPTDATLDGSGRAVVVGSSLVPIVSKRGTT
jgi:hypothetical protein